MISTRCPASNNISAHFQGKTKPGKKKKKKKQKKKTNLPGGRVVEPLLLLSIIEK
jgi:hypothetical protein